MQGFSLGTKKKVTVIERCPYLAGVREAGFDNK